MKQNTLIWITLLLLSWPGSALAQDTLVLNGDDVLTEWVMDSLQMNGIEALLAGDAALAQEMADELLSYARSVESRQGMGDAYYLLGRVSEKSGDLAAALRYYFMAVREFEWTGSSIDLSETYSRMGDIYFEGELFSKAREYYQRARNASTDKGSLQGLVIIERLADSYYLLQEYDSALVLYRELLEVYEEDYPDMVMATLMQAVSCLYRTGRYEDALAYNQQALEHTRRHPGDPLTGIEALNSLGYNHKYLGNTEQAVEYFQQAARAAGEEYPGEEIYTVALVNLAIAYQNAGKMEESVDTFMEAMEVARTQGNTGERSRIAHLLSYIYYLQGDYYNAKVYNDMAMEAARSSGNDDLLKSTYQMASLISTSLYDYEAGMIYYQKYLSLRDSLETLRGMQAERLAQQENMVERTEKELAQILYERELEGLELKNLRIESEKKQQEVELLRKTTELQDATIRNQELEKNRALQELLLAEEKLATERKDREIQDLKVQQQLQESELKRRELEQVQQQQEIENLTIIKELNEVTIEKQRARNLFLAGIVILALVILVLLVRMLRYARRTNRTLSEQRNKIQQQKEAIEDQYGIIRVEKEKSERLLLNILPVETARELKEHGRAVPKKYDKVTVLFTDFVGFTMVAEKMTPEELVRELDECFMEFDRIIGRHNLEKIKTIGDAYMCAGGIPVANHTNPFDAVEAALEIRGFMDRTRRERLAQGMEYWQLRIGIHTGEVVAGVVGKKKFAYDIWGDAVNTASRMESSGEAGKVNISGSTFKLVKERYKCTYRGKVHAKNKGEVDMYFVDPLG